MLSRPITRLLTGAAVALLVLLPGTQALADDPLEPVACTAHPQAPGCTVAVDTPQRPGGDAGGNSDGGSGAGGDDACHWVNVDDRPPPVGGDPHRGSWYMQVCGTDTTMLGTAPQWIVNPPEPVVPAVLARQASADFALPSPKIRANPDPGQDLLVQVPIWLWVDPSTWGTRSATASVPGVSVTATARPTRVRWDMGDGTAAFTCKGPGTPWRAGIDPNAASPNCGHVYRRSSAGASGAAFAVRATVNWAVSWVGGGTDGALPALTTTSTLAVRVAVSQAINGGTV